MSWVIIIDDKISLLRRHELFTEHSYHYLCKHLAIAFTTRLCETTNHDLLTVVSPSGISDTATLHPFTRCARTLESAILNLPEPHPVAQLSRNFPLLIQWTLSELFKYWGPSYPIQLLVFTDAGATKFTTGAGSATVSNPKFSDDWPNVSVTFVSLNDGQLSDDLLQVHHQFAPNSTQLALGSLQPPMVRTLQEFTADCVSAIMHHCLPSKTVPHPETAAPTSVPSQVSVRFGHLGSLAYLVPALRLDAKSNITPSVPETQLASLCLEIFGFLHVSDLSNPPVASRHQLSIAPDTGDEMFLPLLMTAMQNTKTVAMCSISVQEATRSRTTAATTSRILRHGFLHQYDAKWSVLLLSVFHQDCKGLPWLGQFQHLAPVTDFAGSQLYDDRDGSSPFPVRVPDRLSYAPESTVPGQPQAAAGAVTSSEPFRYVSWVSSASLTAEVNKVLRLGRRLPDKATIFFKELNRLRTAALAYGCPELLKEVVELTEAAHPSYGEGTAPEALKMQLANVSRILLEPDFRPSTASLT